ncbi:MAG: four helix bundle protein [Bacteroidota bacterium]|nr:four helix bundle protein [Bacteroidota bacterium]
MHNFKELKVWQKAVYFATKIMKTTSEFPSAEKFGISSQMNRAAVSIPSQSAEGCGRNSDKNLVRFLSISTGSAYELETQLFISNRMGYIDSNQLNLLQNDCNELQKMIFKLQKGYNTDK